MVRRLRESDDCILADAALRLRRCQDLEGHAVLKSVNFDYEFEYSEVSYTGSKILDIKVVGDQPNRVQVPGLISLNDRCVCSVVVVD